MLKHVQMSSHRCRLSSDTLSLNSNMSCSSLSFEPLSSRSSSYSSLNEGGSVTTIKVYARCLRQDIEYKTLSIKYTTTCREVVEALLNKYRMRHRDPKLFYLTMEVTIKKSGFRTVLALDEKARPAVLQSCHPRGESRFCLQAHRGGLVKVYDSALMSDSKYKSLLISEQTTADDLIQLLLNCNNNKQPVEHFSLYEVSASQEYQRKLHPDDYPLHVQYSWKTQNDYHFLIRRNNINNNNCRSKPRTAWERSTNVPSPAGHNAKSTFKLPDVSETCTNYFYI